MPRSIAEQSDAELGGAMSVLVRQKRDHVRLDRLLADLSRADGDDRAELLQRTARLVFSHAFAEEAVLWPALRRVVPDGEALTLRVEREHQEINELAAQLDAASPGKLAARGELVDRLVDLLQRDVRDEEDVLLPRLQQALNNAELQRLGAYWEVVRRTAPTRPHPHVARRPPGNIAAAVPLSVLDRSRDALVRLARHRSAAQGSVLQPVVRILTTAADRVEKARAFRVGERTETRSHLKGEHDG